VRGWRVVAGGLRGAALGAVAGFTILVGALVFTSWRLQGEPGDVELGPLTIGTVEVSGTSTVTEVGTSIPAVALLLVVAGGLFGVAGALRSSPRSSPAEGDAHR
jgi:hypothetical protein